MIMDRLEWSITIDGKLQGPYSDEKIRELIRQGKVRGDTMLWSSDGGWTQGASSPFAEDIANAPEPPTKMPFFSRTDSEGGKPKKYFWGAPIEWYMVDPLGRMIALNFLYLIFSILTSLAFSVNALTWTLGFVAAIALMVADYRWSKADAERLRESGINPPQIWVAVLFPSIYFLLRYLRTREKGNALLLYALVFFLWLFTAFSPSSFSFMESALEAAARPIVNESLVSNFGRDAASCTHVEINRKVSDRFYNATAYLDNGNSIQIVIKREGDSIYVQLENPLAPLINLLNPFGI